MKRMMEVLQSDGTWKYDNVDFPGKLIVIEGIDGAGKSTITNLLSEELIKRKPSTSKYDVRITREPGATPICKKLKTIINTTTTIDYVTDFLLFAGCRNENINKVIIPSLKKGDITISDRYVYSSFVYQGLMNNDYERIYKVHKMLDLILVPDILFILDIDPITAIKRTSSDDKFEKNNIDYFKKIQNFYIEKSDEWATDGCQKHIIDCNNKSKDEIVSILLAKINENFTSTNFS
jgi:dTMP kinase